MQGTISFTGLYLAQIEHNLEKWINKHSNYIIEHIQLAEKDGCWGLIAIYREVINE